MVEGSNPSGPAISASHFTPSSLDTEIVNYGLWLARNGYSSETVKERTHKLRMIARRVGTLLDGEALKDYVAKSQYQGNTKAGIFTSYKSYCKFKGFQFIIPRVIIEDTIPFIPTEQEIDSLISASGRKLGTFLLMLKEWGTDRGTDESSVDRPRPRHWHLER